MYSVVSARIRSSLAIERQRQIRYRAVWCAGGATARGDPGARPGGTAGAAARDGTGHRRHTAGSPAAGRRGRVHRELQALPDGRHLPVVQGWRPLLSYTLNFHLCCLFLLSLLPFLLLSCFVTSHCLAAHTCYVVARTAIQQRSMPRTPSAYLWAVEAGGCWLQGASFQHICTLTDAFEGSIIRATRRLDELMSQLQVSG